MAVSTSSTTQSSVANSIFQQPCNPDSQTPPPPPQPLRPKESNPNKDKTRHYGHDSPCTGPTDKSGSHPCHCGFFLPSPLLSRLPSLPRFGAFLVFHASSIGRSVAWSVGSRRLGSPTYALGPRRRPNHAMNRASHVPGLNDSRQRVRARVLGCNALTREAGVCTY